LEVTKRHTRITGALLLVFTSLMLASLACYSGQIPGVFELTPYHTPTPLPLAEMYLSCSEWKPLWIA
jgi:hypothetical protein